MNGDTPIPGHVRLPDGTDDVSAASRVLASRAARLGRLWELGAPEPVLEKERRLVWEGAVAALMLTGQRMPTVSADGLAAMYAILDGDADEAERLSAKIEAQADADDKPARPDAGVAPPFDRFDRVKRRGRRHGTTGRVIIVQVDKERCLVEWPTVTPYHTVRSWEEWTDLTKVASGVVGS